MTSNVALLPNINRNLPQILDKSESGLLAYASRGSIYVINLKTKIPIIVDSKVLHNAHRCRILSLSFCKSSDLELIATLGEEGVLKIWDLETQTCIANLEVKEISNVVEWLYGSTNSVTVPDTHGYVIKWNFKTNNLIRMKTCSESLVCILASNKKSPELLAAGHSAGSISILDVNNQALLHKLKAHVMDITSLSWSLVLPNLLLSTSADQTARVWKMREDKPVNVYYYPKSRNRMEDKRILKICAVFHPENPDVIICSNVRGCLGEVTFKENEAPKFAPYDERSSDTGFKSVNIMLLYFAENNKFLLTSDHLKMSLWDLSEQKFLTSIYYVNGIIYSLAVPSILPGLMAIATGDGTLRIWDILKESKLEISTAVIHARVKIMCMAWHPVLEGIIAYGSDEGRIGIADVQRKKSLYSFETHHSGAVYTLQWAPCLKIKDSQEEFFLYSCSNSIIYIHELHKPKEKPIDFDDLVTFPPDLELVQKTHCELGWKPDYSCLVIGSFKGFLDLFDCKLNFLTRVAVQMKRIECVKWHPEHTYSSPDGSVHSSWFAAAGASDDILVFNASDITKSESESVLCKPAKTLVGHKKKVSSFCWSPHFDGYMASASRDGTVLVWNVITSAVVVNYEWHKDQVYSVHWSMLDPDIIFSGGMDGCLKMWRISEQTQFAPPTKSQAIKHRVKPRPKRPFHKESHLVEANSTSNEACNLQDNINETPKEMEMQLQEEGLDNDKKNFKTRVELNKEKKGLFYGYGSKSKEENFKNILKLTDFLTQKQDVSDPENIKPISDLMTEEDLLNCGLYCDQLTAIKMLETKANFEVECNSIEKAFLQLMACNVEPLLKAAAEKKQLTEFLVAASLTVSRKFYNEMCEKYAIQLIEEKRYIKACMYLLLCGQLHSGVKLLIEKGKILEALALAKARLPENDPLIREVAIKASNHFSVYRQHENEASCYLAINEPSQAARTLYRSADSKSIYASAYICSKFNLKEEAETYGQFCMEKCLVQNDWPTFYKLTDFIDSLKVYRMLVRVHELICTELKALKKDGIVSDKIFGVTGSKLQIWENKTFGDSSLSLLPYVYNTLKTEGFLSEDKTLLEEIHNALNSIELKRKKYEISEEAHISIAIYVAKVIVASLLEDFNLVTKYFMKIFQTAYNVVFLPRIVCWFFLPFDIYWCSYEDRFFCENKYMGSELLPFTKYFMQIYRSACNTFESIDNSELEKSNVTQVISFNFKDNIEQILAVLSKKTLEESLLLYFSICYLNELRKLAKSGWKFRCYNNVIPFNNSDKIVFEDKVINDAALDKINLIPVVASTSSLKNNNLNISACLIESSNNSNFESKAGILSPIVSFKTGNDEISPDDIENKSVDVNSKIENEKLDNILPVKYEISPQDINDKVEAKEMLTENTDCKIEEKESSSLGSINDKGLETKDIQASTLSTNINLKMRNEEVLESIQHKMVVNESVTADTKIEKKESDEVLVAENQLSLPNINGKVETKETVIKNINEEVKEKKLEYTDEKVKEMTSSEIEEDDHLQCWTNVSLYYTLTDCFFSVNCKDEYAVLYYLKKNVHYLNKNISDLTRQQSAKSVLNSKNSVCSATNQNITAKDLKENCDNHQKSSVASNFLNCEGAKDSVEENPQGSNISDSAKLKKEIENKLDKNHILVDDNALHNKNKVNLTDETSCEITEKNEGYVDSDMLKEEFEGKIHKSQTMIDDDLCNDNEKIKPTGETSNKIIEISENHANNILDSRVEKEPNQMISENLQTEQKIISEKIKLLNSVEFRYPNPFDAVSAVNGICCDIFRKHPCTLVKVKFHELLHKINRWNAKFCTDNDVLKCDICLKEISA